MTNPEPQPDTRVGSNPRIQGRVTTPRVNQSFKVQGRRVTKHPTAHQPVYRVTGRSRDALTRPAWSRPVRAHALASLAAVSSIRVSIRAVAHARSHYTRAHLSQATHHAHKAASAGAGSIQGLVGGGIQVLLLCFPCWVGAVVAAYALSDCCCLWLLLSLPRMYCNRGSRAGAYWV